MPNLIGRLFCRQSNSSLLELDFDELLQFDMTEFKKSKDSYEILDISNEDPMVGTTSTSWAMVDIEDSWMASTTMLSPLERFYHKYIVQYDQREDVPMCKRGKCRAEKKCKRRLSADNTISSVDSLTCDDNQKHKVASTQSEALVKEPSKERIVGKSNAATREVQGEVKFLLRKDWENSDQTSRSEPILPYTRHDEMTYEQMDSTFIVNPAPEDEADFTKEDYGTSAMFPDTVLNEDRGYDYEPEAGSSKPTGSHAKESSQFSIVLNPDCIRIQDRSEQLCVGGKMSQIIILGDFNLSSGLQSSYARRNKASSSLDPSLASEVKRSPMRINGENIYINIGGENTQIKSYKDYGTVKISGRHSKKISDAAARMKKTKASMKPTFVNADVSSKRSKSRSRQFRETQDVAQKNIDVEEMYSMRGPSRVHGPADHDSTEGFGIDNASMGVFMSETLEAMTMPQICSAFHDGQSFIDNFSRGMSQNDSNCDSAHAPGTSVGIAYGDLMEMLNNSAGQLECAMAEEDSSPRRTELPHEDPLRNEAASSKSDCPPGLSNTSKGGQDLSGAQIIPCAEDPTGAQTDAVRDLPTVIIHPIQEEEERKVSDETGLVDIYSLRKGINGQNRQLKKYMTKFREKTENIGRLYKYMEQLQLETAEMRRLLAGVDRQTEALRCEAAEMRCTVTAICDLSVATIGKDTEARRLEPACYRRYLNIRTAADAAAALTAVRNRIKALSDLEVLIYRKQLVLHHVLPTLTQEKAPPPKRVNRPAHKVNKSKKAADASASNQTTSGGGHIVIEVVSPAAEITTPSWSGEVSHTDSPMTISAPLSGSNDGTVSTVLPDTEV